jgi:prepilin signal peptidase PulO-like enzyme (type II secretory pathway)
VCKDEILVNSPFFFVFSFSVLQLSQQSVDAFAASQHGQHGLAFLGWAAETFGREIFLGREALGLGDVKLAAAGGALLGPVLIWTAIAAAAAGTAGIAAAFVVLRKRALTRDLEIPFGPGLLAAIFAAWIAAGGASHL